MDSRCIALALSLFVVGFGLGFAVNSMFFPSRPMGTQLSVGEIEWSLEGDLLIIEIPIDNIGGYPVTIQSISVRENVAGSTEYTDWNPVGLSSGTRDIASGGSDTFEWNATRGSAPFDFLLQGKTYIVTIRVFDGDYQKTTTAPSEWP
ncbi:MAG: hypothetical protein JSV51_06270 [Candidatus Bathyarchaeota archaeon]|nr:MAG: hypothetical protein JSV51_06270 [Candidatus Bathyarchaeota archaeon]